MRNHPLAGDLDYVLDRTRPVWDGLRGARIFITGGTGFFGCWLLESLLWAQDRLGLDIDATVLTRDPTAFLRNRPRLAEHPAITLQTGDVRDFAFASGTFSHVIHAATDASAKLNSEAPARMFDTVVQGTRRALDFAIHAKAHEFLLTSSGAVYGTQPADVTHVPEDYTGAPDPADSAAAYAEGKRAAEMLAAIYHRQHGINAKVARCFAFVGPYLPLGVHFAIGNFIRDGLAGGPIRVGGDGTPRRSYLYAADLVIWLWTILMQGQPARPYNVGSEQDFSIAEIAHAVANECAPRPAVEIAREPVPGHAPSRYVPGTARAREELGLVDGIGLSEAIRRTLAWHRTSP